MADAISRKNFLLGAAAAAGAAAFSARPARAAKKYVLKYGVDLASDHPTTLHTIAAGKEISEKTKGAVEVQVFPNSQLGDDTHMLSSVRSGAIQMMGLGGNILATLVPSCAINGLGFAFKDGPAAWNTLDGQVGTIVRADIEKTGLHAMRRIWDEGFREITSATKPINTPEDLAGFKIRVPPSPIALSLFKDLGAAPGTLNFSQVYTALQTKVFDGQENPLSNIYTQKMYQVQKYCSLTNHMWEGYWILVNGDFWKSMPADYRKIVEETFDAHALPQRTDSQKLNDSLQSKLEGLGMVFNKPDPAPFRELLIKNGFYSEWKTKFDPALWAAFEHAVGTLG